MPKWLDNAVFYQVYPQSFFDSNGDGIGDLRGLISKLDYIKDLGCNAIWINPFYDSPFYDAGYDIRDYYKTAPRYGTNQDTKELFDAVHARGMCIILDFVVGQTSIEHPWFKESMSSMKNRYTDRYIWTPDRKHMPPVDKAGVFKSNLRGFIIGFGGRSGCCAVNFYSTQPALNFGFKEIDDPSWQCGMNDQGPLSTREAAKDIMRFWLDMGCDGFRCDLAGHLVKNDPTQEGNIELWKDFRDFLDKEYPDAAIISEWGCPEYSIRGGFHMDFLLKSGKQHYWELFRSDRPYFSRKGAGDITPFTENFMYEYNQTEGKGMICIPSSNHDISRITECLDPEEIKIAFAFILSMPGAPFIYYGDEIGMRNIAGLDPVEGSEERIMSRTPMQWSKGLNAGFSSAGPNALYAPLDSDTNRPDVETQVIDPNSLYNEIRKQISVRLSNTALQSNGDIRFVYAEKEKYPFVYLRTDGSNRVLVVLNPKDEYTEISLDESFGSYQVIYSLHGTAELSGNILKVPSASASFLMLE